jgi:hypothetical protein
MHRAAMNIVLRCPFILLTLADVSIDFSDNGGLEGPLEERRTIFERKIWCRLSLHSDYQRQGTNIIGQFFLFRHVDLLIHLIIEIKYFMITTIN